MLAIVLILYESPVFDYISIQAIIHVVITYSILYCEANKGNGKQESLEM